MNKAELVEALAQHYDGSRSEAARALNAVVQTITRSTVAGEKVGITGFGVFERVERPARMVRNPRTGERKEAPATAVPRFRPGTELKAYVAGERELPSPDTTAAVSRAPRPRRSTPAAAEEPAAIAPETSAPAAAKATAGSKKSGGKVAERASSKKPVSTKVAAKKVAAKKVDTKKSDSKKSDSKKSDSKKAGKKSGKKK